jgi:2-polyprenyl-3-methyl-5-hydroxy-6-metoxy-1,4-benzoquinol methylase
MFENIYNLSLDTSSKFTFLFICNNSFNDIKNVCKMFIKSRIYILGNNFKNLNEFKKDIQDFDNRIYLIENLNTISKEKLDIIHIDLDVNTLNIFGEMDIFLLHIKYCNVKVQHKSIDNKKETYSTINQHLTNYYPFKSLTNINTDLENQCILYENKFHNDPIFPGIRLTLHEQTNIRGKPKEYILHTINLLNKFTNAKNILEIGSVRSKMNHDITEFNPRCCNDGHSTYFWNEYTTADIYTVDIDRRCKSIIDNDIRLKGVHSYTQDAIEFAKNFDKKIDLLFLDAWDVNPGSPYAEKHLEIYNILKNKLSDNCLILIDDTDVGGGGKGKLIIPQLIKDNFKLLVNKRQTLFIRNNYNLEKIIIETEYEKLVKRLPFKKVGKPLVFKNYSENISINNHNYTIFTDNRTKSSRIDVHNYKIGDLHRPWYFYGSKNREMSNTNTNNISLIYDIKDKVLYPNKQKIGITGFYYNINHYKCYTNLFTKDEQYELVICEKHFSNNANTLKFKNCELDDLRVFEGLHRVVSLSEINKHIFAKIYYSYNIDLPNIDIKKHYNSIYTKDLWNIYKNKFNRNSMLPWFKLEQFSNLASLPKYNILSKCMDFIQGLNITLNKGIDIGCAEGAYTYLFSKILKVKHMIGLDSEPARIIRGYLAKYYYNLQNIDFRTDLLESYNYDEYDFVSCLSVTHHLNNPMQIMEKICKNKKIIILENRIKKNTANQKKNINDVSSIKDFIDETFTERLSKKVNMSFKLIGNTGDRYFYVLFKTE